MSAHPADAAVPASASADATSSLRSRYDFAANSGIRPSTSTISPAAISSAISGPKRLMSCT
jgi:hypothetical protein